VFSAHGVPKSVPAEAERRKLLYLDATCPLVSKVHREAERHYRTGHTVILIGHAGHPEVIGTMGQLPPGAVRLVESVEDVATLEVDDAENLAFATQTTLSLDDTVAIVDALKAKFPTISAPNKQDICYATTNRQEAIKVIAPHCDAVLVIGAPNSSNSVRLVEVARRAGCDKAMLVQRAADLDWSWFDGIATLGITAGASAPEVLVEEVMSELHKRYAVTIQSEPTTVETITFKLPRELSPA
jgi:4-hydroxy-3-methylbut-2-enyl diphosphate reductase